MLVGENQKLNNFITQLEQRNQQLLRENENMQEMLQDDGSIYASAKKQQAAQHQDDDDLTTIKEERYALPALKAASDLLKNVEGVCKGYEWTVRVKEAG